MFEEWESTEYYLQLHKQFRDKKSQQAPVISYRYGDFFFSGKFRVSESLNVDGVVILPEMLGGPVIAGTEGSTTRLDRENPWLLKFLEFTDGLVELSAGRFPVGQPIMRGPSGMMGVLLGQTGMIYLMNDDPPLFSVPVSRGCNVFS